MRAVLNASMMEMDDESPDEVDGLGIGNKGQPDALVHDLVNGFPGLEGHVPQGGKDRKPCKDGVAAVPDTGDHGTAVKVRSLWKVACIGNHDPEADTQGKEDLPVGGQPDLGVRDLFEVRFQVGPDPLPGSFEAHPPEDENTGQKHEKGDEDLAGQLDAPLNTPVADEPVDQPDRHQLVQDGGVDQADFARRP